MTEPAASPTVHSQVIDEVDLKTIRRKGIGGSDVAALAGLHPWRTAHDVWMSKMGLAEIEETEAILWGRILEPIIGEEYARREGVKIVRPDPRFVRDRDLSWMLGSLDFLVAGRPVGVDPKSTNWRQAHRWGDPGTDQVPEEVLCQMQWYLWIKRQEIERWDVPVLLGQELRIYRVYPNADLQRLLIEIAGEWWERYVLTKTPPPIDHTHSARKLLERVFPRDVGEIRQATPDEAALAYQYRDVDAHIAALEQEKYRLRNLICTAIGDDAGLRGEGFRATWKRTKDSTDTNWEMAARFLLLRLQGAEKDLEAARLLHSKPRPGVRRFLPQFGEGRGES